MMNSRSKLNRPGKYQQLTRRCLASHAPIEALTHFDPNRRRVDADIALPLRDIARLAEAKRSVVIARNRMKSVVVRHACTRSAKSQRVW